MKKLETNLWGPLHIPKQAIPSKKAKNFYSKPGSQNFWITSYLWWAAMLSGNQNGTKYYNNLVNQISYGKDIDIFPLTTRLKILSNWTSSPVVTSYLSKGGSDDSGASYSYELLGILLSRATRSFRTLCKLILFTILHKNKGKMLQQPKCLDMPDTFH